MSSKKSNSNGRAKNAPRTKSSTDNNGSRSIASKESSEEPRLPQKLRYTTEGANNFVPFRKELIIFLESKYGNAGTFVRTGQKWSPPTIPEPPANAFTEANDPHGLKKRLYIKSHETRQALITAATEKDVAISADILSRLSVASLEAVRSYAPPPALVNDSDSESESGSDDEAADAEEADAGLSYADFQTTNDPLTLWRIIEATHVGALGGSFVDDAIAAIKRFVNLSQSPSESTDQFKERTDNAIIGLESAGVPLFSRVLQAGFYIAALDNSRYATLKSELRNDESKGLRTRPKTLLEAHSLAIKRMNVVLKGAESGGSNQQVFVAKASSAGGRDRRGGPKNPGAAADKGAGGNGKNTGNGAPGAAKDKADQPCRLCGQLGHWCAQCPDLERAADILSKQPKPPAACANHKVHVRIADLEPDTVLFCALCGNERIMLMRSTSATIVLLDTGATVSVFFNRTLLTNVRDAPHPVTIHGVGGNIRVDQVGDFGIFGEVYYSADAIVNVLALSKVASESTVAYHHCASGGAFHIQLADQSFHFTCEDGLYVCDFQSHFVGVHTVRERESMYTKREVEAARHALELVRAMGYPSMAHLVKLMNSGAILNLPVTIADLHRAQAIYGPDLGSLKGKTKNCRAKPVTIEHIATPARQEQELHGDIMFINGDPFLLVVATPLGMTFVRFLKSRTAASLSEGVTAIVKELTAHGFKPTTLLSDGEGGLSKIVSAIHALNMLFNPAGPNMHVPVVENKIKQVKERCKAILNTLPFKLAQFLLKWLVSHVVTRLNMCPSSTRVDPTCPRELFLQRKIDYDLDLRISFGVYVQVNAVNTIRNSMESRTEPAIALTSIGNLQGSFQFYCISTGGIVTRDQWTILPMPDSVIEHMNKLAAGEKRGAFGVEPVFARGPTMTEVADLDEANDPAPFEESPRVQPLDPSKAVDDIGVEPAPAPVLQLENAGVTTAATPAVAPAVPLQSDPPLQPAAEVDSDVPDLVCDSDSDSNDEEETPKKAPSSEDDNMPAPESDSDSDDETDNPPNARKRTLRSQPLRTTPPPAEPTTQQPTRYPSRANRTSWRHHADKYNLYILASKASDWGLHISVSKALDMFGDKATDAIAAELQQMIDLQVWTAIYPHSLSPQELKSVIYSSMFLKEKFLPNGEFEKLKARLVANGSQQDKSLYETCNVSSPTVALSSVFIAAIERRHVVTMDIIGAYLKIPMTGKKVRVRLSSQVAKVFCKLAPDHEQFLLKDGSMIVQLDKALYGCLESGKLLFDDVRRTLLDAGFTQNPYDQCVFNRGPLATQTTICLYVDDLLITGVDLADVDNAVDLITGVYKTVKVNRGKLHSYLGMMLDFSNDGDCKITMDGYVDEVLRFLDVTGTAASPASATLFDVRESSPLLKEEDRQQFHTGVATLLYLAKRVRPDILTAVSFLATRATKATADDLAKLSRVLKYLNGSKGMGLVLSFDPRMLLIAYVDVSYGVHADAKSHTGGLLSLGGAAFAVKSTKQKLVTKSSTEGELVGVSDYSGEIIEKRNLLIAQGYEMEEATLYQDNMSTIALIRNGRPTSDRTRHVNIRFFYIKDRVDAGEVTVKHMPTANMIADILTKPLQGELFRKLRAALLNWHA